MASVSTGESEGEEKRREEEEYEYTHILIPTLERDRELLTRIATAICCKCWLKTEGMNEIIAFYKQRDGT